ncbi:armadillo-type protein [Lasiosphaeria miniovina]|uniref:Armadillo-type protein n=1 Tax=Lasiosphaeria miniovina TaxID=1954250 RepID=A0AA40A6L9_9PEZI|nr:armadillo-type protein [Lasiosphaeria miniovina]KAK0710187.1 armadillo-type protein [Lasiosphaeria miniovina]
MDQQKLAALLLESQAPDTQRLKAITAELQKNYYAHPGSLLLLIELIATHGDVGVRQQAAIQAARLVPKHWEKIPADQKGAVRQHLVQATMKEPNAPVRHADSRVVAAIGALDLEDGEWLDLLPALFNLASSNDVAQREVGSYIIFSLLEANPTSFSKHTDKVLELFGHTIRDPHSADVRINTMMSIGAMLLMFEPEEDGESVATLQTLVPPMVEILKDAVQAGDDEKTGQAFEVFQQFLAYESALLGKYLKDLVQFMIDLAANTQAEDDVRSQALSFLAQTVRYRRMKIQGMKDMGQQLTLKSMVILTEIDDDEDEDEMSPARSALALLDQLANDLPPRQVIVPLLEALPKFATSEDVGYKKAGALALGTVVEGAPDFIASQVKSIMPHIVNLLNDADVGVRHTALIGLSRLADDIAEELSEYNEALMTALVKNLQAAMIASSDPKVTKKNVDIIRSVCGALDSMSDGLDAEFMKKYAGDLVSNIGALVAHDDYKVKVAAAGALGAIAESLDEDFAPYFEKTMLALGAYLSVKETEEQLTLRSGVCDSMGRIASAVGAQNFQPFVLDIMRASEEALHLDSSRLRESSFILWSSLAKVYEKEFTPFLPGVFKGLFESLELEEEEFSLQLTEAERGIVGTDEGVIAGGKKIKIRSADDDDGENDMGDDDSDDWEDFGGVTPEALEKEVAVEILGDIITYACGGAEIKEYLEKAVEMIAPLADHTYEGVRKAAIATLWRAYARVWQVMEEETGASWEPGLPLKQTPTVTLAKLGEIVTKATLHNWNEEADRSVVTEINRNVAATLKACGPGILAQEDMMKEIVTVLTTIVTRSHPCQQDLGDEDEDQEVEGTSEYDWLVIDTALDVVIGLAVALGPSFAELWKVFEKPILRFASSESENLERSTGVGVIAECAANMEAAVTPYTAKLLNLLLKRLSDTDLETRSNAAYATGQLIYNSTDSNTYLAQYDTILRKLEPMLQIQAARIKDNAAGCICRMIMSHPDRVPISEVLPALVGLLPLKDDYEENSPVYECIFRLYEQNDHTIQVLTPTLIPIFEAVLNPPTEQLDDETREIVRRTVHLLFNVKPDLFSSNPNVLKLAGVV